MQIIRRFLLASWLLLLLALALPAQATGVDIYELSGADLGLGVGTRAVGMAGAFSALADGPEALYFNVAGLARVQRTTMSLMTEYPFHISFAGIAIKSPWQLFGRPLSIGVGITSRLRVRMEGDFGTNDRARDIVRLSLIYIPPTFVGGIDSTTYDYQVALALPALDQLDVGISGSRVDCLSTFFGLASGRVCQHSAFWQFNAGGLGDLGPKSPMTRIGPTLGLTYHTDRFSLDGSLQPDIGRTFVLGTVYLNTSATLSLYF